MKDLTQGRPIKAILLFSLPMLAGSIFQQFYNMADLIIVGRFLGVDALAAVGSSGSSMFFLLSLVGGLTGGASIVIAQHVGSQDDRMIKRSVVTAVIVMAATGVFITVVGSFIAKPLLTFLQTPAEILPLSSLYLRITFMGALATVSYNGISSILRAFGDSLTPLFFLIIATLLNIGLDIFFVTVINLGIAGIAIATVSAQAVSALLCLIHVYRKHPILRLKLSDFVFDPVLIKQTVKIGIPASIQNSMNSIAMMGVQSIINSFGTVIMAGAAAANKLDQIAMQPMMTIGMSASTYTAQNVGAGKFDRVNKGFRSIVMLIFCFCAVMIAFMIPFAPNLLGLFISAEETETIAAGVRYMRTVLPFLFLMGFSMSLQNLLRGSGDVSIPLIATIVELPVRFFAALALSRVFGANGIWWAGPITWAVNTILCGWRYRSGKWKLKRLVGTAPAVATKQ